MNGRGRSYGEPVSGRITYPRFKVRLYNRRPSEREILDDLRRVARLHAPRPLSFQRYREHGQFALGTMARQFGSWSGAVQAAGLPPSFDHRATTSALLENLAAVWRQLGRQPGHVEMVKRRGLSRYSAAAYRDRFGSWNEALLAFARFARGEVIKATARPRRPRCRPPRTPAKRRVSARLRSKVLIRDNCQCRMCGTSPLKDAAVTLHVDHIVPWSKGGRTVLNNLQTLCARCNIGKSDLSVSSRQGETLDQS